MKRIYHVLINPIAGCGAGARVGQQIIELLETNHFTYHTYETTHPDQELLIVQKLLDTHVLEAFPEDRLLQPEESFPILVVIGGDGTLHHVVNQLHAYGANYPVAYIPAGKENDFARALNLSTDPTKRFWQLVETRKPKLVPLIQYKEDVQEEQRVFFNKFGIGMDAKIQTHLSDKMNRRNKVTFTRFAYFQAVFSTMFRQKPFPMRIEMNGTTQMFNQTKLCTITNHPYSGEIEGISSKTDVKKKSFELVVIERLSFYKKIALLLQILQRKKLDSPSFKRFSLSKARLTTTSLEESQIDGEKLGERCFDINFTVTQQSFW